MPRTERAPIANPLAAVILAGGQSRRMGGGQKGLRPIAGRAMIEHVIARLQPQVMALAISANAPGFETFAQPILADTIPGFPGPLAGILAGLTWARSQTSAAAADYVVSVAGDIPFLPRDLVARLVATARGARPVVARSQGRAHFVVALWPLDLDADLSAYLMAGGRRVQEFCARHDPLYCDFEGPEPDPFFNVNTPADLARAEAYLRENPGAA